ncbi:MAG: hypothetical protein ABI977_34130 [Acidobacteriota bacterium]
MQVRRSIFTKGRKKMPEEEVTMFTSETAETTGFKQCQVCGAEQFDRDKFCRRCGVCRSRYVKPLNSMTGSVTGRAIGSANRTGDVGRPLSAGGTLRRPYSGPLVGIVTRGLSEQASPLRSGRWARFLISALVAVPLWLMIVLLSPLDAYVAAKDIAKQC